MGRKLEQTKTVVRLDYEHLERIQKRVSENTLRPRKVNKELLSILTRACNILHPEVFDDASNGARKTA